MSITVSETNNTVVVATSGPVFNYGFVQTTTVDVSLTTSSTVLGASASIAAANTPQVVIAQSLSAGTWIVTASLCVGKVDADATALRRYAAKLTDDTTVYASAQCSHANSASAFANQLASMSMSTVVTLASTTTVKMYVECNATGSSVFHQAQANTPANYGASTMIKAIRIA
jgi:hypothetical protein